jgi:hypothetical protein
LIQDQGKAPIYNSSATNSPPPPPLPEAAAAAAAATDLSPAYDPILNSSIYLELAHYLDLGVVHAAGLPLLDLLGTSLTAGKPVGSMVCGTA